MKIILPIYYEIEYKTKSNKKVLIGLNWYRNAHHFLNNKVKHFYHELVREQHKGERFDKVELIYDIYQKRENTDGHNIRSIVEKYALDGMVEVGILDDDTTPKNIVSTRSNYYVDNENPRMEITIIPYEK